MCPLQDFDACGSCLFAGSLGLPSVNWEAAGWADPSSLPALILQDFTLTELGRIQGVERGCLHLWPGYGLDLPLGIAKGEQKGWEEGASVTFADYCLHARLDT